MAKRRWIPPSQRQPKTTATGPAVAALLLGEGLEEITEALIQELLARGQFKEADMRGFQKAGFRYHRERNSFFSPPEGDGIFSGQQGWLD
jgi:hypothetical protein